MLVSNTEGFAPARFELRRVLGRGSFGAVYEAFDREHGSVVALKRCLAMDPTALRRFKNEFRFLADVKHPNLVSLYELHGDGQEWFFTMEFVRGQDLLTWVRPGYEQGRRGRAAFTIDLDDIAEPSADEPADQVGVLDLCRLRDALADLVRGVAAMHDRDLVHRDLKPGNILITQDGGRAVILDFGLTAELAAHGVERRAARVGTPVYMAPEQATGAEIGPAADWYSVGATLFEVLTGHRPFTGDPARVFAAKHKPPDARAIDPSAPEDLARLARDLMAPDPADRPTAAQVMARLGIESEVRQDEALFVGRDRELARLRALADADGARAALLIGSSGMGKTALAEHFLSDWPGLVLRARSWSQETVPFKALDGAIDELAEYLGNLDKAALEAVQPADGDALARLFPVLRDRIDVDLDPSRNKDRDMRRLAAVGLRDLLHRLSEREPLALLLDDVQWGDTDSAELLLTLLQEPEPPPLLLLATVREDEEARSSAIPSALAQLDGSGISLDPIEVGGLDPEAAADLWGRLADAPLPRHLDDAEGNPFLLAQLARGAVLAEGTPTVGAAIRSRVAALAEEDRRLLEHAALAGRPLPSSLLRQVAGIEDDHAVLGRLRAEQLISVGADGFVRTYHDRIRETVSSMLPEPTAVQMHRDLADAIEARFPDEPEMFLHHRLSAGQTEEAATLALVAAERAMASLAFHQAARSYATALALTGGSRALHEKHGRALVNAGRGAEAADAFLAASTQAFSDADAAALRKRAVQELLIAGHVDRASQLLKQIFADEGLVFPESMPRSLWTIGMGRARLAIRGTDFRIVDDPDPKALARIDSLIAGSLLIMGQPTAGFACHTLALEEALAAGEPTRIVRTVLVEAMLYFMDVPPRLEKGWELLHRASELAARLDDPHLNALQICHHGIALWHHGRWADSEQQATIALEAFSRVPDSTWGVREAKRCWFEVVLFQGKYREAEAAIPAELTEAAQVGYRHMIAYLHYRRATCILLGQDDVPAAREAIRLVWAERESHGSDFVELIHRLAESEVDLYEGKAVEAWTRMRDAWSTMKWSPLYGANLTYIGYHQLWGRTAVAAAAADPSVRRKALSDAQWNAAKLRRVEIGYAFGHADVIDASRALLEGDRATADERLASAEDWFVDSDMQLHTAAIRWRTAQLDGDEATMAEAARAMFELGAENPDAMVAALTGYRV